MTLKEALESGYCSLDDEFDFDDTPQGEEIACLKLEIERLKRQIKIKDEWCRGIWMVGANYDGYGDDLKRLRKLVDELIDYSNKARTCDDKSVAYVSWEGEKEIKSNILMERIESDK